MIGTETMAPGQHVLMARRFGIILHEGRLAVGHVIAQYSQSGGKAGAHSWQQTSISIGGILYISMQVYEALYTALFRAIHGCVAVVQSYTFAHIHCDHFLCILPGDPTISQDRQHIHLDEDSLQIYSCLMKHTMAIVAAVKQLKGLRRRGAGGKKSSGGAGEDGDGCVHEL
ncbi:hypothetical protein HETIRDRAFT_163565 [Heterobasidion irregulare TC 32-1]|uniref:Uncharacterized protein n=1 Tax=Heterobasidion irregulare (strain TC 32-1) TaxID=747525 RepID=W4KDI9_HETIT|nr:uncharacterized protein HETIRDRAFT_163565 [Heterobasidion irregulare TC 32-1]ETW83151.1 hypothetical protein HETIRDRAFT_163565 [Heterobasidion irregulare TC 32-1]